MAVSAATSHEPTAPAKATSGAGGAVYRLFGITLATDFPFVSRLLPAAGNADVLFTCSDRPPLADGWDEASSAPSGAAPIQDGKGLFSVYRLGECHILRFRSLADFYVWPDRIICHPRSSSAAPLIEIYFLGVVMAYWLERRGVLALHAAAVSVGGQGVVFLGGNGSGKSSLAAGLMRMGHALLTDDILAVECSGGVYVGRPGYPTMRLWPPEARHFLGSDEGLALVHPLLDKLRVPVGAGGWGTFCPVPQPLACIYVTRRRNGEGEAPLLEISPLPRSAAVVELSRLSFIAHLVQALGWQSRRLDLLAGLVQHVPVRRLTYRAGFEHLPAVCSAVLQDVG